MITNITGLKIDDVEAVQPAAFALGTGHRFEAGALTGRVERGRHQANVLFRIRRRFSGHLEDGTSS